MAVRLHANNQRHWSPSLLARSIAYFGRTSRFLRANEGRQRRIASKPMIMKALRIMREYRPQPEWKRGLHIKVFAYDQTYQWVGMKKRGRRQAVERLDGAGLPTEIRHEVYINSIDVALPSGLGTLSQVHAPESQHMPHMPNHTATHATHVSLHTALICESVVWSCRLPLIVSRQTTAQHTLSHITIFCCPSSHLLSNRACLTLRVMRVLLLTGYISHTRYNA